MATQRSPPLSRFRHGISVIGQGTIGIILISIVQLEPLVGRKTGFRVQQGSFVRIHVVRSHEKVSSDYGRYILCGQGGPFERSGGVKWALVGQHEEL
jgi:hypothetical protein